MPNKASAVNDLLAFALHADRQAQKERRVAERGDDLKRNPYFTDFGACPRKVYYSLKNVEPTNPPGLDSLANFLFGKNAEEAVATILEGAGAKVIREVRVEIPWVDGADHTKTSGRSDFLVFFQDLETIVELKTTKQRQVSFLPQSNHVRQLNGYLEAGSRGLLEVYGITPEASKVGVLTYVVKDAVKGKPVFHSFEVQHDPDAAMKDLKINALVAQMVKSGVTPERPTGYKPDRFPCSYCDYRDHCWGQA